MKSKFLCLLLAACAGVSIGRAADAAKTSDSLNASYVEGVRLISDANAAIGRANRVLSIVEQGADSQTLRIATAEQRLQIITTAVEDVNTAFPRRLQMAKELSAEKIRLDQRFQALETALADERTILKGATETVESLLNAADRSGKLAERRLADESARQLKLNADHIRAAAGELSQIRLRVALEATLQEGLQSQAAAGADDLKMLKIEVEKQAKQVAGQRTAVSQLSALLVADRARLAERKNSLGQAVELFRVVQVAVLRHWLVDGPPMGAIPTLSIDDVMEAGIIGREDSDGYRATNSMTGTRLKAGEGLTAALASRTAEALGLDAAEQEADPAQASAEVIQLHKKARWYLAMLSRLTSFAGESIDEANGWTAKAEYWRSQLNDTGRTLAEQRGALTSLTMEQGIVATTIELMTKQAATARGQVDTVVAQVEQQTKRLEEISTELKAEAEKK